MFNGQLTNVFQLISDTVTLNYGDRRVCCQFSQCQHRGNDSSQNHYRAQFRSLLLSTTNFVLSSHTMLQGIIGAIQSISKPSTMLPNNFWPITTIGNLSLSPRLVPASALLLVDPVIVTNIHFCLGSVRSREKPHGQSFLWTFYSDKHHRIWCWPTEGEADERPSTRQKNTVAFVNRGNKHSFGFRFHRWISLRRKYLLHHKSAHGLKGFDERLLCSAEIIMLSAGPFPCFFLPEIPHKFIFENRQRCVNNVCLCKLTSFLMQLLDNNLSIYLSRTRLSKSFSMHNRHTTFSIPQSNGTTTDTTAAVPSFMCISWFLLYNSKQNDE